MLERQLDVAIVVSADRFTRRGQAMQIVPDFIDESYSLKQFAGEAMLALVRCGLINPRKGKQQTTVNVKTFLNRIFGINIQLQGRIFRYFHDVMEAVVADAKKSNTFSEGIVDCSGESIKIAAKEVIHNGKHGGETFHVEVDVDRGVYIVVCVVASFYHTSTDPKNPGTVCGILAELSCASGLSTVFVAISRIRPDPNHEYVRVSRAACRDLVGDGTRSLHRSQKGQQASPVLPQQTRKTESWSTRISACDWASNGYCVVVVVSLLRVCVRDEYIVFGINIAFILFWGKFNACSSLI